MDGPPPSDPGILEGGPSTADTASEPSPASIPGPRSLRTNQQNPPARQPSAPTVTPAVTTRHSQPHQLLSVQYARGQVTSQPVPTQITPATAPAPTPAPALENDLFSLDFHAPPANPTPATTDAPKKDTKQDILSLFSAPAAPSPWTQAPVAQPHPQPLPPFSNVTDASSGTDWNVGHNWSNPAPPMQPNVWGATTTQQPSLLGSGSDIWGGSTDSSAGTNVGLSGLSKPTSNTQPNKEDVFGDIWGSFK
jgi:stromal membrane-associated protein